MLAMQMVSQLQARLGRSLAPTLVFDWPTAAELATHLREGARTTPHATRNETTTQVRCVSCLSSSYHALYRQ